ncbi:hypothetical protein [Stenotrophomonas pigmentata]|uniref:hypothetical protein n=1 Tax=Stenotrophomonas pigmentata TaxID=3055080 RepID=UPI0026F35254|nr:hypothetical protein [Stenotrophomonas sp. 610A2]
MTHLYRYIPIWRRIENGAVLYRAFEVIGLGYSVQSKDFFYADALKDCTASMEAQFLELLIEQAPDERCGTSATIEAAVLEFEQQFFHLPNSGR